MGNACCNNADKDQHAKDFAKPQPKDDGIDPLVLENAKANEDKIIKIQA